jgi:hypothetical protein
MTTLRPNRRELLRWCGQGIAAAPFVSLLGCGSGTPKAVPNPGGPPTKAPTTNY